MPVYSLIDISGHAHFEAKRVKNIHGDMSLKANRHNYFTVIFHRYGTASHVVDMEKNSCKEAFAYLYKRVGALPVTLIAFNADKKEQTAELFWATSAEVNSRSFEISRSRNGKAWETIGNVDAAGSNGVTTKYFFTDNHPFRGENLYRLKMIDQDGSFTLSQIRSLLFEKNLVLYPNPASDKIYLDDTDVYSLEVLSITGQKVMSASVTANSGVSISHLLPGMYMMKIRNQDGEVHIQKMWIKR